LACAGNHARKGESVFCFYNPFMGFFVVLLGSILKDYEDEEGGEGRR